MKAIYIEFNGTKKLAVGMGGEWIKGPIIYAPEKGLVLYISSIMGDVSSFGVVPIEVDYFEDQEIVLRQLKKQVNGENLEHYVGEEFNLKDLSLGVEIDEKNFDKIKRIAHISYRARETMRDKSWQMLRALQKNLQERGLLKIIRGGEKDE